MWGLAPFEQHERHCFSTELTFIDGCVLVILLIFDPNIVYLNGEPPVGTVNGPPLRSNSSCVAQ